MRALMFAALLVAGCSGNSKSGGAGGAVGTAGAGGAAPTTETMEGQACQTSADCGLTWLTCAPGRTSPALHCRGNCRGSFDCSGTSRAGYVCCHLLGDLLGCLPPDESDPAACD